jgi:hypothetical protein
VNERERFAAIMSFRPFDRLPVWFFGTWAETKERWSKEGLSGDQMAGGPGGPHLPEMDHDWESGLWHAHGLVNIGPISDELPKILEETSEYKIVRDALGAVKKHSKTNSSIPHTLEHALKPNRESWERFKHTLDPDDPRRWPKDWRQKARELNNRSHVAAFMAGSLFGWLREWLGLEEISYLPYDNPELFDEMVGYLADYFLRVMTPVLRETQFDLGYIFEDCCGKNGALFSPATYQRFFASRYRRMVDTYHSLGVPYVLLDSDGKVDDLLPLWLDSGLDIVFPIEIGTWEAHPARLRQRYGTRLRMMGGVDKHVIPRGETAIRLHLEERKALVLEGGYIPLPDHRIPPECSLEQFRTYLRVFREVFASQEVGT